MQLKNLGPKLTSNSCATILLNNHNKPICHTWVRLHELVFFCVMNEVGRLYADLKEQEKTLTSTGGSIIEVPEIKGTEIKYIEQIGRGCFGTVFVGECRGKTGLSLLFAADLQLL